MKTTALVIMAAGLGSRFGGGIKQLEPVGCNGEIIMDYSIHDAIEAGFNQIIFIIRKDIEAEFKECIGNRIEKICNPIKVSVSYCYQDMENIPVALPEGRKKPWGTGHAVLSAKHLIHTPFAVINADDYYGKEAFVKMHNWLIQEHKDNEYSMAAFILKNTLSENGSVTRGICKVEGERVVDIIETKNISKESNQVVANESVLDPDSFVSMNMWGFPSNDYDSPAFINLLQKGFIDFFKNSVQNDPLTSEYLLPIFIGDLLRDKQVTVELLDIHEKWFGVTYKEDAEIVVQNMQRKIADGIYKEHLYDDLL